MRRETYQRGVPGAKWGIWNCSRKEFQFDIIAAFPMALVSAQRTSGWRCPALAQSR